jgi:hypothetical protein
MKWKDLLFKRSASAVILGAGLVIANHYSGADVNNVVDETVHSRPQVSEEKRRKRSVYT